MLVQNRDTFLVQSSTAITVGLVKLICELLSTTVVHGGKFGTNTSSILQKYKKQGLL